MDQQFKEDVVSGKIPISSLSSDQVMELTRIIQLELGDKHKELKELNKKIKDIKTKINYWRKEN